MTSLLTSPLRLFAVNPAIHYHHLPDGQPHVHAKASTKSHPEHRVLAVCGKGGVGKTAFSALATHALLHRADTGRLLVVDADPAFGLALALGIESDHTIASVREQLLEAARVGSQEAEQNIAQDLDYLLFESLVETNEFAFIAMGRSHELGCYCSVNDLLRDAMEVLIQEFDTVLIDGEAGLEQINRQVVAAVDDLIVVSDGSLRGQRTVESIVDMTNEHDLVPPERIHLVLNRQTVGQTDGVTADAQQGIPHKLGLIPADDQLAAFDRAGTSLLELPDDNPAAQAVQRAIDRLVLQHPAKSSHSA